MDAVWWGGLGRFKVLIALLLLAFLRPVGADEVLDRFLGEWQTEVIIRRGDKQFQASGLGQGSYTLEGSLLEFRGRSLPPGDSDLQLMLYDPPSKTYLQWLFDSSGYRHQAEGRWDPETQVLRWQGKLADGTFQIDDHFVGPGRLEWTLMHWDSEGKVVREIEGVLTRVGD